MANLQFTLDRQLLRLARIPFGCDVNLIFELRRSLERNFQLKERALGEARRATLTISLVQK
jgi:hypothetical protein